MSDRNQSPPQTSLHPDKFAGSDDAAQTELAESWSSLVNDSYNRLLRPLERAQYLLELSGQPLAEGEIQVGGGLELWSGIKDGELGIEADV